MITSTLLAVAVTLTNVGDYEFFTNSPSYSIVGEVGMDGPLRGESVAFLCDAVRERMAVIGFSGSSGGAYSYDHPPYTFAYYAGRFPSRFPQSGYAYDSNPDDTMYIPRSTWASFMSTNNIYGTVFAWGGHRTSDSLLILTNEGASASQSTPPSFGLPLGRTAWRNIFTSGAPPFSRTFDYAGFYNADPWDAFWMPMRGAEISNLLDDLHNNNAIAFDHEYYGVTKPKHHELFERSSFSPGGYGPSYVPPDPNDDSKPYGYIGEPRWERDLVASNINHYVTQADATNSNYTLFWRDSYKVERWQNYGWRGSNLVSTASGYAYEGDESYTQPYSGGAPVVTFEYALKGRISDIAAYGVFKVFATEHSVTNLNGNPMRTGNAYKRLRRAYALKRLPATLIEESEDRGVAFQLAMNWPSLAISIMTALGDSPPGTEDTQMKNAVVVPEAIPAGPSSYLSPTNYCTDIGAKISMTREYRVEFSHVLGVAKILYKARKAE